MPSQSHNCTGSRRQSGSSSSGLLWSTDVYIGWPGMRRWWISPEISPNIEICRGSPAAVPCHYLSSWCTCL